MKPITRHPSSSSITINKTPNPYKYPLTTLNETGPEDTKKNTTQTDTTQTHNLKILKTQTLKTKEKREKEEFEKSSNFSTLDLQFLGGFYGKPSKD